MKAETLRKILPVGAFGISILIHLCIFLFVSGFVLIEAYNPPKSFQAENLQAAGTVTDLPPEIQPEQNEIMPNPVNQEPVVQDITPPVTITTPNIDVIVSTAPSSNTDFTMAAAPQGSVYSATATQQDQDDKKTKNDPAELTKRAMATLFGSSEPTANTLVGHFYDVSRFRNGKLVGLGLAGLCLETVQKFVKEHGKASVLKDYWVSKNLLYAKYIMIPGGLTAVAFESFGEKPVADKTGYLVHYTGSIALPAATTFRFNVIGNDYLIVMIDGNSVAIADLIGGVQDWRQSPTLKNTIKGYGWESPDPLLYPAKQSYDRYTMGSWLTWEANQYHKIDILIGDTTGGGDFYVYVEEKSKTYREVQGTRAFNAHANRGIPILPYFRVDRVKLADAVKKDYITERCGVDENGPVFIVEGSSNP